MNLLILACDDLAQEVEKDTRKFARISDDVFRWRRPPQHSPLVRLCGVRANQGDLLPRTLP